MSLFNQASLVVTPNGYKAGKLYSIKPTSGAGDLDVVRATGATRVNASGLIETVGNNVPRLDYPPLGGCPSILVEPQRTNLVFPSDVATTQTRTVTAVAHTLSFYGTGTVVLSGVAIATLSGTGANNRVTLTFTPTAGSLILTVTGSVLDWQLEVGANATSYIPTVASTVTRNADLISKTGISDLIGQTEGTLFADININNLSIPTRQIFNIGSSIANFVGLNFLDTNVIRVTIRANFGTLNRVSTTALTIGRYKLAVTYKAGELKLYVNGSLIGTNTDASVSWSEDLDRVNLDNSVLGGDNFSDKINLTSLYKTALTNQECIDLTTL
jgi:hypothetical protein